MTLNDIRPDLAVYTPDGEHVGQVTALLNDAFELERGLLHGHMTVPFAAVGTLQPDGVHLRVPLSEVDALGGSGPET